MNSYSHDPVDAYISRAVKSIAFWIALMVTVVAFATWLIWPTWEDKNKIRLIKDCESVEVLVKAGKKEEAYEAITIIQSEVKGKKIKDRVLRFNLEGVSEISESLGPKVLAVINERRRLIEVETEMRERYTQLQKELVIQKEATRLEKEKLKERYRRASSDAKDALNSLKKLAAYTEVGVNKIKYSEALGVTWGDIKIFVESPKGKGEYVELSMLLTEAVENYKLAAKEWGRDNMDGVQLYWGIAGLKLRQIDDLLNQ